ncbi:MAG: hypothetical protein HYX74_10120 [Acidobacteria bacterium]|nr:hypothetical protein [Acidobacteriota bacterium]
MKSSAPMAKSIEAYLQAVGRSLRRRRSGRVALVSLTGLCALLLLGLWHLYQADFGTGTLASLRVILIVAGLGSAGAMLAYWMKPISLLRVARYLEEKNPQLQQRLITAVDRRQENTNPFWPMLERDALRSARSVRMQSALQGERPWLLAALAALGLTCALFLLGPPFFRYGLEKLLAFSQAKRPLYEISVLPGNVKIAPGMDQEIQARPVGFDPDGMTLFFKFQNQLQWERISMERSSFSSAAGGGTSFGYLVMDIREPLRYYVEGEKIRSAEFQIEVADWPRVEKISLYYLYPSYTGLKPNTVENEGNIRAIRGTRVQVRVRFNESPQKPVLFLEKQQTTVPLTAQQDGSYLGELQVQEDSQYWVRTDSPRGDVRSSQPYEIVALQDQPPLVRFNRPGKDERVSSLQEVPVELEAEDDFGLSSLKLNYSVNGGEEKSIQLFGPGHQQQVTGAHTFYLEEMQVQPGDFVSYYAEARDAVTASRTDIYFLEVKPFEREFYQSQQSGQGGRPQDPVLSRRQKEIIAGTWKTLQEDPQGARDERSENFRTLSLVQQRLQQQVQSIADRLKRREGSFASDATARQMLESLEQATQLMEPAHQNLSREQANEALRYEQQALQRLLRAEALMREVQVAWGASAAGGGGGESRAEELADLFELERDQMKNQYETLQQSQPGQRSDPKLDEALQKLKELARRQQQNLQDSSAAQHRQLQQETEELARQLERLSRQRQNPQIEEIARQLQEASRSMQGALQGQGGEAVSNRALDQLRRAQSQLSRMQQQQRQQQFSRLNQSAENLARQQQEIEDRVSAIQQQLQQGRRVSGRDVMNLLNEKEELRRGLRSLEQQLDEAARENAAANRQASQELKGAANEIRDRRLDEKVQQGNSLLQRGLVGQAWQREHSLTQEFRDLQSQVARAGQAASGSEEEGGGDKTARMQQALQDAGRLLDQLEQMQRAQGERGQQSGSGNQQAKAGQPSGESRSPGNDSGNQQGNDSGDEQGQNGSQSSGEQPGNSANPQGGDSGTASGGERADSSRGSPADGRRPSSTDQNGAASISGQQPGRPSGSFSRRGGEPEWAQFWGERLRDAQELRRSLQAEKELARQVDELMERMRQLDSRRGLDLRGIEALQASIIQGFRALELKMSLRLQERKENLQLFNQEDVPPEYRKAVEEYYKSLARSRSK